MIVEVDVYDSDNWSNDPMDRAELESTIDDADPASREDEQGSLCDRRRSIVATQSARGLNVMRGQLASIRISNARRDHGVW